MVPTLRNLARLAMVFSKDMSYFFEPDRPELFRILRAADRQRLPQTGAEDPGCRSDDCPVCRGISSRQRPAPCAAS